MAEFKSKKKSTTRHGGKKCSTVHPGVSHKDYMKKRR